MAVKDSNEFDFKDIKSLLNVVVSKVEMYHDKIDNIERKVSDLSVIRHQIDNFQKQVQEILIDIKNLREDFQNFKSVEYKVDDLLRWKQQIEQTLTVSDMNVLKNKTFNQELTISQLTERLSTVKEEIKKESTNKSIGAGAGAGGIIVALVEIISYLIKH